MQKYHRKDEEKNGAEQGQMINEIFINDPIAHMAFNGIGLHLAKNATE